MWNVEGKKKVFETEEREIYFILAYRKLTALYIVGRVGSQGT
jgi:hypothetical protein